MKSLTHKSLGLAIVTALAAVGLFALASPAGAYAPAPPPPNKLAPPPCQGSFTLTANPLGGFTHPTVVYGYEAIASGWAIDPEAGSGPINVRADYTAYDLYGFPVRFGSVTATANLSSSDPNLLCWGLGSQHGFYVMWAPLDAAGSNEGLDYRWYSRVDACVTAINVGYGRDTSLGCQTAWPVWP